MSEVYESKLPLVTPKDGTGTVPADVVRLSPYEYESSSILNGQTVFKFDGIIRPSKTITIQLTPPSEAVANSS